MYNFVKRDYNRQSISFVMMSPFQLFGYELVQMSSYVIVEFLSDNSVECVPRSWIHNNSGSQCAYWPNTTSKAMIKNAIKKKIDPDTKTWESCAVRIMAKAGEKIHF